MSRTSRWDRPPAPKDFRWSLRLVGKVLIGTGLLMFGFVAYQLWGTGIQYARAQDQLKNEFEEVMEQFATSSTSSTSTTTSPISPTTTVPAIVGPDSTATASTMAATTTSSSTSTIPSATTIPDFSALISAMAITDGSVVGRIEIPEMELDDIIVAGVEREQLAEGPGLFPQTPMPGQLGNSALAGHRTTHGQPFYDIDDLEAGDEIIITVPYGTAGPSTFVYIVTSFEIVAPSATHVIATTDPTRAMLTLTSCHPRYSASQRYIVYADLDVTRSSAPGQPVFNYGRDAPLTTNATIPGDDPTITATAAPTEAPTTTPVIMAANTAATLPTETSDAATTTAVPTNTATVTSDTLYTVNPGGAITGGDDGDGLSSNGDDALSNRWFSDKDAFFPVATWAAGCAAIVVGAYQLAKRLRNSWIGLAGGVLPFVVGLYFFYQNVNRLLPAAL